VPWDFRRHSSGVRDRHNKERPLSGKAVQGRVRLGAPSVRLFLVRLRPRRAELRFTGPCHRSRKPEIAVHLLLTRSEVPIRRYWSWKEAIGLPV